MAEDRLPTALWVEAHLRKLEAEARPYYVINTGDHSTGLVMLKISDLAGACRLVTLQRNFETDQLEWGKALEQEEVEDKEADEYIRRSIERDPDLWVIEIEDREKQNPFEDT